jgi:putrescine aminotransferase
MTSGYVPMGGVMISDAVADVLMEKAGEIYHGYTYSGHPAACAAGLANLRILREERLVERAAEETAPHLADGWRRLADHPLVGEARIKGLIGALELVRDKETRARFPDEGATGTRARDISVNEHRLVMRAVRDTLVISPPLCITKEECDMLLARARATLDTLLEEKHREGAL